MRYLDVETHELWNGLHTDVQLAHLLGKVDRLEIMEAHFCSLKESFIARLRFLFTGKIKYENTTRTN